jgi:hypothetical protein
VEKENFSRLVARESLDKPSPRASICQELSEQMRRATVAKMREENLNYQQVERIVGSSVRKWVAGLRIRVRCTAGSPQSITVNLATRLAAWLDEGQEKETRSLDTANALDSAQAEQAVPLADLIEARAAALCLFTDAEIARAAGCPVQEVWSIMNGSRKDSQILRAWATVAAPVDLLLHKDLARAKTAPTE